MNAKDLRIVFMGTPEFAVPSLRRLAAEGYNVAGVVTAPDKPAGRGRQLHKSEVKIAAEELGLPILQPEKLKAPEFVDAMRAFRMLPEVIWAMPRLGTFNLHASLLPQYRGAAPINWAIINGETETGITTFLLNHEIDKGAILGQKRVPIAPEENVGTLYDRLMNLGPELVTDTVERLAAGADRNGRSQTGAQNFQGGLPHRLELERRAHHQLHSRPFALSGSLEPAIPPRRGGDHSQNFPSPLRAGFGRSSSGRDPQRCAR